MISGILGLLALSGLGGFLWGNKTAQGDTVIENQTVNTGVLESFGNLLGGDNNLLPVILLVMLLQGGGGLFGGGGSQTTTPVYVNVVDDDDD